MQSTYQIQRGDTLEQIAKRFNTTSRELMRLNGIKNPHAIIAGENLKLPGDRLELSTTAREATAPQAPLAPGQHRQPKHLFLQEMMPAAERIEAKYGLPAEVIVAQAALESNWGKSAIGTYNVFGIKGEGSLGSIRVSTREHYNGQWHRVHAQFAHYASFDEAFEAYAQTLQNGFYDKALAHKADPVRFARGLQGVYATDPRYGAKLVSIMRSQGLL